MTLFSLLLASTLFALGFSRGKKELVKANIKHSVTVFGKTYHPNSQGVSMPRSHAVAIGAEIIPEDFPGGEQQTKSESKEGELETKDAEPASDPEITSGKIDDSADNPEPTSTETDSETKSPEKQSENDDTKQESEPSSSTENQSKAPVPGLPEDFPGGELLLENGLDSVEKVLAHPDLTDIKGIGNKIAEQILTAAKELESKIS